MCIVNYFIILFFNTNILKQIFVHDLKVRI